MNKATRSADCACCGCEIVYEAVSARKPPATRCDRCRRSCAPQAGVCAITGQRKPPAAMTVEEECREELRAVGWWALGRGQTVTVGVRGKRAPRFIVAGWRWRLTCLLVHEATPHACRAESVLDTQSALPN